MARTCSSQRGSAGSVLSSSATVGPGMYSFRIRSYGTSAARSRGIGMPRRESVS